MKNDYEAELLKSERREICKIHAERLDRIDHALYGNGNPQTGLLWIAAENGKVIRLIKRISWASLSVLGIMVLSKVIPHIFEVVIGVSKN